MRDLSSRAAAEFLDAPAPRIALILLFQSDRVLGDLVECGHRLGIGFETSLGNDQVGEFCSDVHIRHL